MKQREVLTTLARGEIGETFHGRFDTQVYQSGARRMVNIIPIREGGATSYSGSEFIATIASQSVLTDFVISPSLSYLLVFSALSLTIYRNGTTIVGSPIHTPYALGDLTLLRFAQTSSMLVVTTRAHPPKVLEFLGGDSFRVTVGGALPDFTENMTFTPGRQPFVGAGNFPALCTFFQGRAWFFSSNNRPGGFWASSPFQFFRFVYFETISNTIRQLRNPDTQAFIGTTTSGSAVITTGTSMVGRVTTNHFIYGPGIQGGSQVVGITAGAITINKPATASGTNMGFNAMLWVTTNPEYETVVTTRNVVTDASAIEAELASDGNDMILWAIARKDLVLGTTISEWVIPATVTAVNLSAEIHSRNGSGNGNAILMGNTILYPSGGSRGIREFLYSQEDGGYKNTELTFTAPHILSGGIVKIDWQNSPRGIVWVLLENGTLAVAGYEKAYDFSAWARVEPALGSVQALAIIPTATGDEVFLIVSRPGGRTLERVRPFFSSFNLDVSVSRTVSGNSVSGIAHIRGAAFAHFQGVYHPITVSDLGVAAIPPVVPNGSVVNIGLRIGSRISLLRPNVESRFGTAQGRLQIVNRVGLRLLNSGGFRVSRGTPGTEESSTIQFPFSGDATVPFRGSWDTDGWADIISEEPFTVLNIFREITAGG